MIRYFYLRNEKNQPIGCVASKLDREGEKLLYHFSILHKKDQFNRTRAREIADGRLEKEPLQISFAELGTVNAHSIHKAIMTSISANVSLSENGKTSSRARMAASRWLASR